MCPELFALVLFRLMNFLHLFCFFRFVWDFPRAFELFLLQTSCVIMNPKHVLRLDIWRHIQKAFAS